MPISLLAETFEGPGVAAGVGMPIPAIPVAPIPVVPFFAHASAIPTVLVSAVPATLIPASPSKFPLPFILFFIYFYFFESFLPWLLILPCVFLNRFTSHCPSPV